MARPLRLEIPGAFYHVLARGNERKDIFLDAQDYRRFLRTLGDAAGRHGLRVHAYCLMPNHYHLLLETIRPELSSGMHRINSLYSQHFNRRHDRIGHLFQGRLKALLVGKNSYFLAVHRYIHQNPILAELARRPWDYEWSSCREFLGVRPPAAWLEVETALGHFGGSENERRAAYARFLESAREDDPSQKAFGQIFLGDSDFVEDMRRKVAPLMQASEEHPGRRRFEIRPTPDAVIAAVTRCLAGKGPHWSGLRYPAKSLAVYLLRERAHLPLRRVAVAYGLSLSGVSRQVSRMRARLRGGPGSSAPGGKASPSPTGDAAAQLRRLLAEVECALSAAETS